ncbi:MAG: carbohydrate ABC transporter permease [Fimbriimonas sp.]
MLLILAVPALLPMLWMITTSLKDDTQIYNAAGKSAGAFSLGALIPNPFKPSNYAEALASVPLVEYLRNTLILCTFSIIGAVGSSALVAYGFARVKFAGRDVLFLLMISTMALPGQVTMIPRFAMFREFGWYGTYLPLIVPTFFASPFLVFLLKQFFQTLPEEMSEAARVDGASDWTVFTRLVLPLSRPALATCSLFVFLGAWNDFFGPLLYINNPARYTLAYGLQQFLSAYGGKWAQLMAASTLFTVPIIILFFFAQKTFIQGISTTGGKS